MITNSSTNNLSLKDYALITILIFMWLKIEMGKLFRHIKACGKVYFHDVFMVGCCSNVALLPFELGLLVLVLLWVNPSLYCLSF